MLVLAVEAGHEAPQLFWVFGRGSPQWCVSESVSSFRGRGGPKKKGPVFLPPAVGGVDREVVARGARARRASARGRRGAPRRVDLRALAAGVGGQAGVDGLAGRGARLARGAERRQAGAAGDGRGAAGRAVDAAGAPGWGRGGTVRREESGEDRAGGDREEKRKQRTEKRRRARFRKKGSDGNGKERNTADSPGVARAGDDRAVWADCLSGRDEAGLAVGAEGRPPGAEAGPALARRAAQAGGAARAAVGARRREVGAGPGAARDGHVGTACGAAGAAVLNGLDEFEGKRQGKRGTKKGMSRLLRRRGGSKITR